METSIVDECWKKLEYRRIMREILAGDKTLRVEIEKKLRETREDEEAVEAILAEEAERMAIREYEQMLKKLSELTVMELDGDMVDIEMLIKNMMIVESGEKTGKVAIIDMDDVDMVVL